MIQIKNTVEDKVIREFTNHNEFIDFAEQIRNENQDYHFSILGLSDAIEYIEEFCDNLELIMD